MVLGLVAAVGGGVLPPSVAAQETLTADPGAFCSLFTDQEASAAFGIDLTLTGISTKSCTWSPPGDFGSAASLVPMIFPGTLDENRTYYADFPGGIADITVGGQPGLLRTSDTPWKSGIIFTEALGEVLQIDWEDFTGKAPDADVSAALKGLMEAALPRMASVVFTEPTAVPMPSFRSDPDLAARFPATVGGQPLTPQTAYLADLMTDPATQSPELVAALTAMGKTVDDVTFGQASIPGDSGGEISAFRVIGADANAFLDQAVALSAAGTDGAQMGTAQVAGRDVRTITDASGEVTYVLPTGDVVWEVVAQEPALSEIIGALH
jgi:hypothetical protein